MTEIRDIERPPSGLEMLLKAGLAGVPLANRLPGIAKTGTGLPDLRLRTTSVSVDPAHLAAYDEVCGFVRRDTLPLTYPHLLGLPLSMQLMSDPSFPHVAVGQVHLANSITSHRELRVDERFDVTVGAVNQRPHPKGVVYDMVTEVAVDGEVVWEEASTYLRPGRRHPDAPAIVGPADVTAGSITWRLPADLGRRYAAVSGDRNPIHLTALTAKAFGFKQQIAHGMWSMARCVAAVESRLAPATRLDVVFKKPIFLPATVALGTVVDDDHVGFSLSRPDGGVHLSGSARPL